MPKLTASDLAETPLMNIFHFLRSNDGIYRSQNDLVKTVSRRFNAPGEAPNITRSEILRFDRGDFPEEQRAQWEQGDVENGPLRHYIQFLKESAFQFLGVEEGMEFGRALDRVMDQRRENKKEHKRIREIAALPLSDMAGALLEREGLGFEKALTPYEVSEATGIAPSTIRNWVQRTIKNPPVESIWSIADACLGEKYIAQFLSAFQDYHAPPSPEELRGKQRPEILCQLRRIAGLTDKQLGELTGVSAALVCHWEKGETLRYSHKANIEKALSSQIRNVFELTEPARAEGYNALLHDTLYPDPPITSQDLAGINASDELSMIPPMIKLFMERRDWNIAVLAEKSGIDERTLAAWINENQKPHISHIKALEDTFETALSSPEVRLAWDQEKIKLYSRGHAALVTHHAPDSLSALGAEQLQKILGMDLEALRIVSDTEVSHVSGLFPQAQRYRETGKTNIASMNIDDEIRRFFPDGKIPVTVQLIKEDFIQVQQVINNKAKGQTPYQTKN